MMGLYFLVLLTLGMLRPVRNTLALDGLGQTDFYKVYLVSAVVVVFVPLLNWISDRVSWQRLIPASAVFLALNLLVFRAFYAEGSTPFGLVFYGWYDLFSATLVAQFFMVAQFFFHARMAKYAYPLVIGGGAVGASAGGAVTGFLAPSLGTPNLLLVAAAFLLLFSVAVAWTWSRDGMVPERGREPGRNVPPVSEGLGLRAIFSNRQVLLIAGLVVTTVLVKQFVDYQFNTVTKEVFGDRDAIAAFQGKFGAATQWLPILVLVFLRRPLERWGVGFAVLVLPVAMLLTNVGLIVFWGLWAAAAAKAAESGFRYSAERAAREILYLPVPDEIKLKAKAYIDMAVEKGVGKVLSAGILFLVLSRIEVRQVAWVGGGFAVLWIAMALAVRREYVRALARAVEGRFASLQGVHATLGDASTRRILAGALRSDDRQSIFALDLLEQAAPLDSEPLTEDLHALLERDGVEVRRRALGLLLRIPGRVIPDQVRPLLVDPDPEVRKAAVRVLHAADPAGGEDFVDSLLREGERATRRAVLQCIAEGDLEVRGERLAPVLTATTRGRGSSPEDRMERALVAAALRPPSAGSTLEALLADPDPEVARTAIHCAGLLGEARLLPLLVAELGRPATREAARQALVRQGPTALPVLAAHLLDPSVHRTTRRHVPAVLARIPHPDTPGILAAAIVSPETDQLLDFRSVKALGKLRARHPDLPFDAALVDPLLDRALAGVLLLAETRRALDARAESPASPAERILPQALAEAEEERLEEVFRILGLLHDPQTMRRCHAAVTRGATVPRANALEWLETTLGYREFQRVAPVLGEIPAPRLTGAAEALPDLLLRLQGEEDRWLASLAACMARNGGDPRAAREPGPRADPCTPTFASNGADPMDLIETVFLLQQVDVLRDARTDHLALLASIAEPLDLDRGTVLLRAGERSDALYLVVRGQVTLAGAGQPLAIRDGEAFGTWSLIDDVPSVVEATVTAPTRLLRVARDEFHDLMADHPELAIGMLQGLARRVRTLVT
jgi:ATP/ADP translocase